MRLRLTHSTRLVIAILLTVTVPITSLVGLSLYLRDTIRMDIDQKVEMTLHLAMNMEDQILEENVHAMKQVAVAVATDPTVAAALAQQGPRPDLGRFKRVFPRADMLLVVDRQGVVIGRLNSAHAGDTFLLDGLITKAIAEDSAMAYPALIGPESLQWESEAIRQQVDMPILATSRSSDPRIGGRVNTALALAGVSPVRGPDGRVIGAAIAADILNRDFRLVDEVARRSPESIPMNATIAMDGIRVTTNVRLTDPEGNKTEHRALGTVYSDEVMAVLRSNEAYIGRALVVDQWQRTIYHPLTDYRGEVVAGPYVGIPEEYFTAVGTSLTRSVSVAIAAGAIALLIGLGLALSVTRLAIARDQMLQRIQAAITRVQGVAAEVSGGSEALHDSAGLTSAEAARALATASTTLTATQQFREGAPRTIAGLRQLGEVMDTVADGARQQGRSVAYLGRVVGEIAVSMQEAGQRVNLAIEAIARLNGGAREGIRRAGEFTAGAALLQERIPPGEERNRIAALLRDPADLLTEMARLAEGLGEEIRVLAIAIRENEARLSVIEEEMGRVGALVEAAARKTQQAEETADSVTEWLEQMAHSASGITDEVQLTRSAIESIAAANERLRAMSGRMQEQAAHLREAMADLGGDGEGTGR